MGRLPAVPSRLLPKSMWRLGQASDPSPRPSSSSPSREPSFMVSQARFGAWSAALSPALHLAGAGCWRWRLEGHPIGVL